MPPMLFTALMGLIFNLFFSGLVPERLQFPVAKLDAAIVHVEGKHLSN